MFDPVLLRTFLIVARGNSFSATSEKLAVRQSTVSDHIRRLEQQVGRQLFIRDTHSVRLTPDGEALIGYATSIEDTTERAKRFFAGSKPAGRLRLGASEDLASTILPELLADFTRTHPEVQLELTVALSTKLINGFDSGEFDLVFCKRWPGEDRGELVWRDEIIWIGRGDQDHGRSISGDEPWPLILYRPPSITRSMTLAAMSRAEINWRLACTSDSLSGILAATQSGLGVTILAARMCPAPLVDVGGGLGLPAIGHIDFVLLRRANRCSAPVDDMVGMIMMKHAG